MAAGRSPNAQRALGVLRLCRLQSSISDSSKCNQTHSPASKPPEQKQPLAAVWLLSGGGFDFAIFIFFVCFSW